MGNVQSGPAIAGHTNPPLTDPRPHLDFKNMPFLEPPKDSGPHFINESSLRRTEPRPQNEPPLAAVSQQPRTPEMTYPSPGSTTTEWHQGHAKQPDVCQASPGASLHAEIGVTSTTSLPATAASPDLVQPWPDLTCGPRISGTRHGRAAKFGSLASTGSGHADSSPSPSSSISSQLSVLSQMSGGSPRSYRHAFHGLQHSTASTVIDTSMPPEVPEHRVFPARPANLETENVLATIEALECEIEQEQQQGLELGRTRSHLRSHSRSQSLSRSRSRSRSLSLSRRSVPALPPAGRAEDSARPDVLRTDVYTRKCSSPEMPSLQPPELGDARSDTDSDEPASPFSDSSFSLDGYNDGTTRLRVVNLDAEPQQATMTLPSAVSRESTPAGKFRIKSKAQLAEEEDMLRKRYARYGHTFRPRGSSR